jgi:hypothetical protein
LAATTREKTSTSRTRQRRRNSIKPDGDDG